MLFKKNLPVWERMLRAVGGVTIVAIGLFGPGLAGSAVGYIIAAAGVMTVVTGFVGYCPACAVVGRRSR